MRVAIIEDDVREADELSSHVMRYGAEHGVAFSVTHYPTADDFIELQPAADLIFMDIDMPGLNGLDGAREIRRFAERVPLVFVTNLAQYAIRGYEVDAIDFIVKPVSYPTFALHMERIMRLARRGEQRSVALKGSDGMRMVALDDIVSVGSDRHYLNYRIVGSRDSIRVRSTMSAAEAELDGPQFVRVSVSEIVNADHVTRLFSDKVVMDDGTSVFFSRSRKRDAARQIADYLGGDA